MLMAQRDQQRQNRHERFSIAETKATILALGDSNVTLRHRWSLRFLHLHRPQHRRLSKINDGASVTGKLLLLQRFEQQRQATAIQQ
jgi:hypothetical protein